MVRWAKRTSATRQFYKKGRNDRGTRTTTTTKATKRQHEKYDSVIKILLELVYIIFFDMNVINNSLIAVGIASKLVVAQ